MRSWQGHSGLWFQLITLVPPIMTDCQELSWEYSLLRFLFINLFQLIASSIPQSNNIFCCLKFNVQFEELRLFRHVLTCPDLSLSVKFNLTFKTQCCVCLEMGQSQFLLRSFFVINTSGHNGQKSFQKFPNNTPCMLFYYYILLKGSVNIRAPNISLAESYHMSWECLGTLSLWSSSGKYLPLQG